MKQEKDSRIYVRNSTLKFYLALFFIFALFHVIQGTMLRHFVENNMVEGHFLFVSISTLLSILVFTGVLTTIVFFIGQYIWVRPLKNLNVAAQKIAKGDFSVRVVPPRKNGKGDFVEAFIDNFNTMTEELASANEKLKALSVTDELTKLDNRRSFSEYINLLWKQCHRLQLPIVLLMIDVDYFKKYNDSMGHLEGDKALIAIAQCMKDHVKRETDFVARFGGEEFVCLLPFIEKDEALNFAKKLVEKVEDMKIPHPMSEHSKDVTISVGMASTVPNDNNSHAQLLDEADKALYMAKESGRNRVVTA
ncbi:hypothetical protein R80B4_01692 [Fibrobacteres bacterium R8-0-B4]